MDKKIIQIKKYIEHNYSVHNYKNIKKLIQTKPVNTLVEALELIDDINIIKYFLINSISDKNTMIGQFFDSLNYNVQIQIIESANSKLIKSIFNDLEINECYNIIEELPKNLKKRVLISISQETRKGIANLSKYDEDEIGQIMNPSFLKCEADWTVAQATQYLSDNREELSINSFIYVVNKDNELQGGIQIYDVLLEKNKTRILESIIDKTIISVTNDDEIEDVILIFQKYDVQSIPVVNSGKILVGVISDSDIISAISEETTDDIYKMYGITQLTQPYIRTKTLTIVKSRIFWLILLMIASTLTSTIIDLFTQAGIEWTGGLSTIFLIPLIPVITGASGNAGSQSAATLIRALSIGEISPKDYRKVMFKEFNIALVIGMILAVINYLRLILYFAIRYAADGPLTGIEGYESIGINQYMAIASVVSIGISIALFIAIFLSKMIGSSLPLLALKINVDPASMASPLLTTIIDTLTTTLLFLIGLAFLAFFTPEKAEVLMMHIL